MRLGKRNNKPICHKDSHSSHGRDCPVYKHWVGKQGSTVRIKAGALVGIIGRLHGVGFIQGEVIYRIGNGCCFRNERVWVKYADLELTDQTPECECHAHCCSHTHCC